MGQIINRITTCGQCGKRFSYRYDLARVPDGQTDFPLSCPHCQTRQRVALQAVRTVAVLKGGDNAQPAITELTVPEKPVGVVVREQ